MSRSFLALALAAFALGATMPDRTAIADGERSPVAAIAPRDAQTAQAQIELPRRSAATGKRDVFAPHSWAPPPAPPAKPKPPPEPHGPPAPPPAPAPPPLALVYLGQLDVAGEPTVYYLAQGDRVHAVAVGDTIDGVYRLVEREPGGLALLYLPLNARQLLTLNRP